MIAMAISLATAFHRLLHLLIQYLALPHDFVDLVALLAE